MISFHSKLRICALIVVIMCNYSHSENCEQSLSSIGFKSKEYGLLNYAVVFNIVFKKYGAEEFSNHISDSDEVCDKKSWGGKLGSFYCEDLLENSYGIELNNAIEWCEVYYKDEIQKNLKENGSDEKITKKSEGSKGNKSDENGLETTLDVCKNSLMKNGFIFENGVDNYAFLINMDERAKSKLNKLSKLYSKYLHEEAPKLENKASEAETKDEETISGILFWCCMKNLQKAKFNRTKSLKFNFNIIQTTWKNNCNNIKENLKGQQFCMYLQKNYSADAKCNKNVLNTMKWCKQNK